MPDLTGELLTATGYLPWLPRKKKRFAPQKNAGLMQPVSVAAEIQPDFLLL